MKRLTLILIAPLALAGCGLNASTVGSAASATADAIGVPPPVAVADRTVLDEKAAIGAETAYTLAARAAALALRAGIVNDPEAIRRIGALDRQAYAALTGLRAAYRAGNAVAYVQAFNEAKTAILSINSMLGSN